MQWQTVERTQELTRFNQRDLSQVNCASLMAAAARASRALTDDPIG